MSNAKVYPHYFKDVGALTHVEMRAEEGATK